MAEPPDKNSPSSTDVDLGEYRLSYSKLDKVLYVSNEKKLEFVFDFLPLTATGLISVVQILHAAARMVFLTLLCAKSRLVKSRYKF